MIIKGLMKIGGADLIRSLRKLFPKQLDDRMFEFMVQQSEYELYLDKLNNEFTVK
jgi:hypothetical protein